MLDLSTLEPTHDGFVVADRTFRYQHGASETTADDAFLFYKSRSQLEQFERFFAETGFRPERVLELGIWDGGSAVFWTELLDLERYAAIDLQNRGDSTYFRAWLATQPEDRVSTHWQVAQDDPGALATIIAERGLAPLDLVLDDCSHMHAPTLASFELLFPRVRPGGWYVIEDWAWALQPPFQDAHHPWGVHRELHSIVHRLVELHGSRPDIIPTLRVFPDFVAVERGEADLATLSLKETIHRRKRPWAKVAKHRLRQQASRLKNR